MTRTNPDRRRRVAESAELALFETAALLLGEVARKAADYDYAGLYETLGKLRPVVDTFFEDVMVMVDDEGVRKNRMSLLRKVGNAVLRIADVTKIVVDRSEYRA